MGKLILAILCLFVATGTVLAIQPKAQKGQSISHKKSKVKSKPVSLREIDSRLEMDRPLRETLTP